MDRKIALLEASPHMDILNVTQSPTMSTFPGTLNFLRMSNVSAESNSKINLGNFWATNQTSAPLVSSFPDPKFEFPTDAGISDYHSQHPEHPMVSQTPSNSSPVNTPSRWFHSQNTTESSKISVNLSMLAVDSQDELQSTCTFVGQPKLERIWAVIIIMAFTFVSNIIPNLFALFAMFYVLRR